MKPRNCVSLLHVFRFIAVGLLVAWPAAAEAQTVVATIPVNGAPPAVAVNTVANKIYVASCGHHVLLGGFAGGPVAIIDGQTNAPTTYIYGGGCASALAVNPPANKIYFLDENVAVIDGATNSMTAVFADSNGPQAMAVNPITNKIYVANKSGNVNVIDGATNSVTTVTDPHASGLFAVAIAVNPVTNKIYVANNSGGGPNPGSVTVIDGATNSTTTVTDPNAISPNSLAVNSTTNKVYVTNGGNYPGLNHGNITVIDGATNSITTLNDPNALAPQAIAVNQTTNKIYVTNPNDSALTGNGGVTIIDGATTRIGDGKLLSLIRAEREKLFVDPLPAPLLNRDGHLRRVLDGTRGGCNCDGVDQRRRRCQLVAAASSSATGLQGHKRNEETAQQAESVSPLFRLP